MNFDSQKVESSFKVYLWNKQINNSEGGRLRIGKRERERECVCVFNENAKIVESTKLIEMRMPR